MSKLKFNVEPPLPELKRTKAAKWIYSALLVLTTAFIFVNSTLNSKQSAWISNWISILFSIGKTAPTVLPESLTITCGEAGNFYEGNERIYTANIDPSNATIRDVKWNIVPGGEAFISASTFIEGDTTKVKVKALKEGSATLVANIFDSSNNINLSSKIEVSVLPLSIQDFSVKSKRLSTVKETIAINQSTKLYVEETPSNKASQGFSFSSSDQTIASVDENGIVIGKKEGTTIISISSIEKPSLIKTFEIEVKGTLGVPTNVNEYSIDNDIYVNYSFEPQYLNSQTIDYSYVLTSSDSSIISVIKSENKSGIKDVILAKKLGVTKVTMTSIINPTLSKEFLLDVKEAKPLALKLENSDQGSITTSLGTTSTIKYEWVMDDSLLSKGITKPTNTSIEFTSSNPDTVQVASTSGVYSTKKVGQVVITAKYLGESTSGEVLSSSSILLVAEGDAKEHEESKANMRKILGHFLLCLVDGVFLFLTIYYWFRKYSIWKKLPFIALGSVILGTTAELLELIPGNRDVAFKDVCINSGGFLLGAALTLGILLLVKYLKYRHKTNKATNKKHEI